MKSGKIMRSKLYRFLDYLLRLIILNALIVIPSFFSFAIVSSFVDPKTNPLVYLTLIPILIWLFPSVVATLDVIRQYELGYTDTIFKDFFKSIKKHYVRSTIISIIAILLFILLINSTLFFYSDMQNTKISMLGLVLTISFLLVFLLLLINICLVMIYFNGLRIKEIVKIAFVMAFKDLFSNILILISIICFGLLDVMLGTPSYYIMALGGISVPLYIMIKFSFKKYIRIYRKVEEKND